MRTVLLLCILSSLLPNCQCQYEYVYAYNAIVAGIVVGIVTIVGIVLLVLICRRVRCGLKKQYNIVDNGSMDIGQFERNKDLILGGLNSAKNNQNFWQYKKNIPESVKIFQVTSKKEKPFLTQVKIKAEDSFGKWSAQGYILCRFGSMFFWMLKQYKETKIRDQNGKQLKYIIYQSNTFEKTQGVLTGVWFFRYCQGDPECSGSWLLSFPQNIIPLQSQNNLAVIENPYATMRSHHQRL